MRRPVVHLPPSLYPTPLPAVWVREFDESAAETFATDVAAARRLRQPVLPVFIASPGGDVYPLLAMMDTLASFDGMVVTVALGQAMSCGAVLFSCGAEGHRYVAPNATLLLHEVSSDAVDGKAEDQRVNMQETARLNRLLWERMSRNIGKPRGWLKREHERLKSLDWYLTAKGAVKIGLACKIGVPVFEVRQRLDPLLGVPDR